MDSAPGCSEKDRDALVAYLYDECEPGERATVEAHLLACVRCADELESFRAVRGRLEAWTPPEPSLGFRIVSGQDVRRPGWRRALQPAWGFGVAAGIVLVVGLALVGVEVRYGGDGVIVRVGGTERAGAPATPSVDVVPVAAALPSLALTSEPSDVAPWHADLMELGNQLRRELAVSAEERGGAPQSRGDSVPETAGIDRDAFLQQLEGLIAQSERRQQQELALWLTEFAQEGDMQRHADRRRLQQELGALEGVADYLVRVSQR